MSEFPAQPPLLIDLLCFAIFASSTTWAVTQFAVSNSSIGYGTLAGLSFGAMFALGQRVKNRLFPAPSSSSKYQINTLPRATDLPSAHQIARRKPAISVAFDNTCINTMRAGIKLESIAWQDIHRIVIVSGNHFLTMPYWMIMTDKSEIRLPNDTPGLDYLIAEFSLKLPHYNNDKIHAAVITAMDAMEGRFDIWHKNTMADNRYIS